MMQRNTCINETHCLLDNKDGRATTHTVENKINHEGNFVDAFIELIPIYIRMAAADYE